MSSAVSSPAPGNYFIINTVPDPNHNLLALTFPGNNNSLIVNSFVPSELAQVWTIQDNPPQQQPILPITDLSSGIGVDYGLGPGILVSTSGGSWIVTGNNNNYTIQTGDKIYYWYLQAAQPLQYIFYNQTSGSATEFWYLCRAS